jgi:hypothetical protein
MSQRRAVCWMLSFMGRSEQDHPSSLKDIPFSFKFFRSMGSGCSEPLYGCENAAAAKGYNPLSPVTDDHVAP